MRIPVRSITLGLLAVGFTALVLDRAQAGGSHYFPPVTDARTLQECGSCHLAFPPSMLPAASWQRMMADLGNHFGDDASLDPDATIHITRYLVANAGDASGSRRTKLLRGVSATEAPLRITELPKWVREHREVPRRDWTHKDVGSKANCPACHVDAERGFFDDD